MPWNGRCGIVYCCQSRNVIRDNSLVLSWLQIWVNQPQRVNCGFPLQEIAAIPHIFNRLSLPLQSAVATSWLSRSLACHMSSGFLVAPCLPFARFVFLRLEAYATRIEPQKFAVTDHLSNCPFVVDKVGRRSLLGREFMKCSDSLSLCRTSGPTNRWVFPFPDRPQKECFTSLSISVTRFADNL